jgi:hypothetical protein
LPTALDLDGNPMFEVLNTVTFGEEGGKTKQILRARVIKKTAQAAPSSWGWKRAERRAWSVWQPAWQRNQRSNP